MVYPWEVRYPRSRTYIEPNEAEENARRETRNLDCALKSRYIKSAQIDVTRVDEANMDVSIIVMEGGGLRA